MPEEHLSINPERWHRLSLMYRRNQQVSALKQGATTLKLISLRAVSRRRPLKASRPPPKP